MTLFNFSDCNMCKICKVYKNDIKATLNQLFPANVCNIIFEYNSKCLKCQWIKDKEHIFLKRFEGMLLRNEFIFGVPRLQKLTTAEKQIYFFKLFKEAPIKINKFKYVNEREMKKEIDKMMDNKKVTAQFAKGKPMERLAIKSYLKQNLNVVCNLILRCHNASQLETYITEYYRSARRDGEDNFKFRNQYYGVMYLIEYFVIEYIEQLIGDDVIYCDRDGLNEWSTKVFMCQIYP